MRIQNHIRVESLELYDLEIQTRTILTNANIEQ